MLTFFLLLCLEYVRRYASSSTPMFSESESESENLDDDMDEDDDEDNFFR